MSIEKPKLAGRFLDGCAWGAGIGVSLAFILVVLTIVFDWMDTREYAPAAEFEDWQGFRLLNKSHYLNTANEYDSGLHISGEIEFETYPKYRYFIVSATVRNSEGGFVDTCDQEFLVTYKADMTRSFNVHCDNVYSNEQFETYDVSVTAFDR